MRWWVFALFVFASLVLDMSMLSELRVGELRPSAMAVVALFVALWAPKMSALWACLIVGAVVDLSSPMRPAGAEPIHLLGPNVLGYAFACALMLQIRGIVMRRQVFAIAVLACVFLIAASVVVTAILTVRSWFTPEFAQLAPTRDLLRRLGSAAYTGVLALPLGWVLLRTAAWWGFQTVAPGRAGWR